MANPNKAPKWWLIIGIVTFLLGIGGCGASVVSISSFVSKITDAPATDMGDTYEFEAVSGAAFIFADTIVEDCEVLDADGSPVPLTADTSNVEANADGYNLVDGFETDSGATYEVTCQSLSGRGEFKIVEFDGSALVIAAAGIGLGTLLLFLGFIFVIVGIIRRYSWNKKRKAGMYGGGGPSGPMPSPTGAPPAPGSFVPPAPAAPYAPQAPGAPGAPPAPGGYVQPPPAPGATPPPAPGQVQPPPTA